MRRRQTSPSPSWRTFLTNHAGQIMAADFFVVPTVTFRLLFVLVVLAHDRDGSCMCGDRPSDGRVDRPAAPKRFPDDQAPRYLLHDRDGAFTAVATTIAHR